MTVSYHQTVEENHVLLIANKSFENMAKFKYLGTTVSPCCLHPEDGGSMDF
jgi:hypothetical protein